MRHKLFLLAIALLFIALVTHRVWRAAGHAPQMPAQLAGAEEQRLQAPGGSYTRADIDANGRQVPSQKYRGFQARHDYEPRSGDPLCPITRTKADPQCTWAVGGRIYPFCCPPCIDEFVRLAKQHPDQILPPEAYVK